MQKVEMFIIIHFIFTKKQGIIIAFAKFSLETGSSDEILRKENRIACDIGSESCVPLFGVFHKPGTGKAG